MTDNQEKWQEDWFLNLSVEMKLVWFYIKDHCNNEGYAKKNIRLMNICCGTDFCEEQITETFDGKLIVKDGLFYIPTEPKPIQKTVKRTRIIKSDSTDVTDIIAHFNSVCGKDFSATKVREKVIKSRLNEGISVEDLKQAISNFSLDDWPDRPKYCDIVYAIGNTRSVDNFAKWINYKPVKAKTIDDEAREYALKKQQEKTTGVVVEWK